MFSQTPLSVALFGPVEMRTQMTTACLHPCPWCVEVSRSTGQLRPIAGKLTRCSACRDTKAVVLPGLWPGALTLIPAPAGIRRFRADQAAKAVPLAFAPDACSPELAGRLETPTGALLTSGGRFGPES